MTTRQRKLDPRLDLMVERELNVTPEVAWMLWTEPEHLRRWYAPSPGRISECEVDLHPGGVFRFVIQLPDGTESRIHCCYLEVTPFSRLIWTDALLPGYRPAQQAFFTAEMTLTPRGQTTLCNTAAFHRNEEDSRLHAELGFYDGWGTVLDQLATYARTF